MHCDVIGLTSSFWVEMTYKQHEYLRNKFNSYQSHTNKHGLKQFTLYKPRSDLSKSHKLFQPMLYEYIVGSY